MTERPLPLDVYVRTDNYITEGNLLLGDLRTFELGGCKLAGSQAKRIRDLMEDVNDKIEDMKSTRKEEI